MKKIIFVSIILLMYTKVYIKAQETITISGQVTDFEGMPKDSSVVRLLYPDFSNAYITYTDKDGYYKLENVEKGKYMAMYAMRKKEYPRENAVPKDDMRLEFWAWNVIANKDLVINPRYHRLEVYGTTVFQNFGGYPGFFIYFRPMSITKYLSYSQEIYLDKKKAEQVADISVKPENLAIKVFADNELLKINSIQPVEEFLGGMPITGYIVQVDKPKNKSAEPYIVFRIEAENKEYKEKGESLYFYEFPEFKQPINKQ